jgi:hypothetical protein
MHKLNCVIKCLIYPPKYPPAIAKTTCYSNLDLCCPGRCGSATPWEQQYRCVTVSRVKCGTTALIRLLDLRWYLYLIFSLQWSRDSDWPFPFLGAQTAALSLSLTPLEPLKLLSLILLQIHESLSLQIALESSPNCSSSPRALGSRSNQWIMFVTLGACS